MKSYFRNAVAVLVAVGLVGGAVRLPAQGVSSDERIRAVRRVLERLPYYGVFDYIVFSVDRGTVTLAGYTFHGSLKEDAAKAVKGASYVDEVVNKIEVLPASVIDDRIRWAAYYRIYSDDFLSRYAPGGPFGARREIRDERLFPGMEPVGVYPIHIVVKNGRTLLLGVVDSKSDRQLAEVRALEVPGTFGVENRLVVGR